MHLVCGAGTEFQVVDSVAKVCGQGECLGAVPVECGAEYLVALGVEEFCGSAVAVDDGQCVVAAAVCSVKAFGDGCPAQSGCFFAC